MLGILGEVNWSNITWSTYWMQGYETIFEHWTYPLIFLGLIGYVYCISRSATIAAAAICLIFGVYGVTGIFRYSDVAEFGVISWIIAIAAFAGLFTTLFIMKRR